ncbi:endolysin [Vibrio phage K58 g2]
MIDMAKLFLGCNSKTKEKLRVYYNVNCVQLVKPNRRYNMQKGDNWCAMFTSVIAHMVGVKWFPYEVSVNEQVKLSRLLGRFKGSGYEGFKVGDLIVYDWDGKGFPDHIGIVDYIDEQIGVIEGNKRGEVGYRLVGKDSKTIYGFIVL